ncbi:hypothetical protein GCM10010156_40850 [Planobispora rosea]|uniref:Uncharacterized protein n=1 Tax=Planobispora rosea TaxID=35762 RepID=A0A8J3S450_PLARO|nr:hypothetical protein [Planobispora rosea]GGS77878.1 hypothetical protein GCM10010156_40850 [Planobispora rosea]GIH85611.1 hypothetical protein Pro02_40190 [Planobispora rosea]
MRMPLALLLQARLGVVVRGVRALPAWARAFDTLALVWHRRRSEWLVRWFGVGLPVEGAALRAVPVNRAELGAALRTAGGREAGGGPNLYEPLAGLTGTLTGLLAAPTTGLALALLVNRLIPEWWAQLASGLTWITLGLPVTLSLGVIGGGGLLALLFLPVPLLGSARPVHLLLGEIPLLYGALRRLWEQVSGPRERVRHPLLKAGLELADRVVTLAAQVFGLLAVLVARILPLAALQRAGAVAVAGIAGALGGAITDAALSALTYLNDLTGLATGLARRVLRGFSRLLAGLGGRLSRAAGTLGLGSLSERGTELVTGWWKQAEPRVEELTVEHPTVRWLRSFAAALGAALSFLPRAFASPPSGPAGPSPWAGLLAAAWTAFKLVHPPPAHAPVPPGLPPGLPPFPQLVPLSAIDRTAGRIAMPEVLGTGRAAAVRRAGRVPSLLEWGALERDAAGKGTGTGPEPSRERLLETAVYLSLAERIVSPAAAGYVRRLEGVLSELDRRIRPALPVRTPPEPVRLRPRIGTLRLRGTDREALGGWVPLLRRELSAAPYPVPGG